MAIMRLRVVCPDETAGQVHRVLAANPCEIERWQYCPLCAQSRRRRFALRCPDGALNN